MRSLLLIFSSLVSMLLLASGCSQDNFPKYTALGGLRVLAIKASNPEVAAGGSVTLQALVSDIGGNGRTINYTLETCADPGIGFGANPSCAGASDRVLVASSSFSMSGPAYTETKATHTITVPTTIFSNHTSVEQFNGVAYLAVYTFTASDGTQISTVKRIIASTNTSKNANPTLAGFTANNSNLTTLPSGQFTVYPSVATGSDEIFTLVNGDGSTTNYQERLTLTWFASDGNFSRQRTESTDGNTYAPPSAIPTDHSIVFVGVLRDGRGGEDYFVRGL